MARLSIDMVRAIFLGFAAFMAVVFVLAMSFAVSFWFHELLHWIRDLNA